MKRSIFEWDVGIIRTLRIVLLCLILLLPSIAVLGQPTTPPPSGDAITSAIHESNTVIQQNGQTNSLLLVISVVIVVGTMVLARPVLQNNRESNKRLTEMAGQIITQAAAGNQQIGSMLVANSSNQIEFASILKGSSEALVTVTANTKAIVIMMETLETRDGADKRQKSIEAKSDDNTAAIIRNQDAKFTELDQKLDSLIETLEDAKKAAITQDNLNNAINPLMRVVDEALSEMRKMKLIAPDPVVALSPSGAAAAEPDDAPKGAA